MDEKIRLSARHIYHETLRAYWGSNTNHRALGGIGLDSARQGSLASSLVKFFNDIFDKENVDPGCLPASCSDKVLKFYEKIKNDFENKYGKHENDSTFLEKAKTILESNDDERKAKAVAELWCPEVAFDEADRFRKWHLSSVSPNPDPIQPHEIIIQLNALYGLPDPACLEVPESMKGDYETLLNDPGKLLSAYDHPVPVFAKENHHELIKCLKDMDRDVAFEKETGAFPSDRALPVLISISATHENLDLVAEKWLNQVLCKSRLNHIDCYLLSENKAKSLSSLLDKSLSIFTVKGKYACHFTALKYAQLIFEKAMGIRGGFKLDTDEGMQSRNLYNATGKTWLQTLCHPYWGGRAKDGWAQDVYLGINIGEYVDSRDVDKLGYERAVRTPEVKPVKTYQGQFLLFPKHVNQAKGTALFNQAQSLEDFISHPLVKGGGYGIDNEGLRAYAPFCFSWVGRAEDQQFYYSSLNIGLAGIFHPDLRIIHYKESVQSSEKKNVVGTVIADIYRMILFHHLIHMLDVKERVEPFPGIYATDLARAQAFFCWLYIVFTESAKGNECLAQQYLDEGIKELVPLLESVDNGSVTRLYEKEKAAWQYFIGAVDRMKPQDAVGWIQSLKVG